MFTRKKHFNERLKFNLASFTQIVKKLQEGGFHVIKIKIPKEYKKFDKFEFTSNSFIELNYNFVSQILIAESEQDTIKILFINNSDSKATFDDTIFPSSNSEFSKFSIETKDPVRIPGLLDFTEHLLTENSLRSLLVSRFQNFLILISYLYLFLFTLFFTGSFANQSGFLKSVFYGNIYGFSLLLILAISYTFFHTVTPGGLYLNKFEHPVISFIKRITVGDFKDNLIISFLLKIFKLLISGFLVNLLWYFLGDLVINAANYFLK